MAPASLAFSARGVKMRTSLVSSVVSSAVSLVVSSSAGSGGGGAEGGSGAAASGELEVAWRRDRGLVSI